MGYCLSCGKLRDLIGGFCQQCRMDIATRKSADAKLDRIRILKEVNRNRAVQMGGSSISQQGNDDFAQELTD